MIRQFSNKLQSDTVLILSKLASAWSSPIQSCPCSSLVRHTRSRTCWTMTVWPMTSVVDLLLRVVMPSASPKSSRHCYLLHEYSSLFRIQGMFHGFKKLYLLHVLCACVLACEYLLIEIQLRRRECIYPLPATDRRLQYRPMSTL